jgi:hypothetical protein
VLDARPEPVILVGDSMGDIAISQPTEYRPHKVEALVYLTANLLRDGESLLEVLYQPCVRPTACFFFSILPWV